MLRNLFILFLFLTTAKLSAQVKVADSLDQDNAQKESNHFRLPIVGVGVGALNFNGDVGYTQLNEPLTAHSGFQIDIQQMTEDRFSFGLFILSGKMLGEEKTVSSALNFKSSIFTEGLFLRYDFKNRKRSDQILIPFLTAGVEYVTFNSKSDLVDEYGRTYQYWNDGTIRDIAQNDPNADQSVLIHRDYNYESDLRDANLDGFGKYNTSTPFVVKLDQNEVSII